MSADLVTRVESACTQLVERGVAVTFAAVATHAGVAKATLYRRPELRAIVEEHRRGDREAHSLSGIVVELDLLRQGLEAVAAKVRRHEEELRALRRQNVKQK
jgi:AcrR family transcriptional regulator